MGDSIPLHVKIYIESAFIDKHALIYLVESERVFIDGEHRAVREDHDLIIGQSSIEGVTENFGVKKEDAKWR